MKRLLCVVVLVSLACGSAVPNPHALDSEGKTHLSLIQRAAVGHHLSAGGAGRLGGTPVKEATGEAEYCYSKKCPGY